MTDAPTKEIAIGMKISDLAILPQLIRSVSWAAIRPKAVDIARKCPEWIARTHLV